MELSLEASRYSLGYAAFEAAYLGSYELLFASVYSAPLVGPNALVPPGAATSPVMLGVPPNITGGITGFDYDESSTWVYGAFETDSLHFGTSIGEKMEIARVSFQAQRSSSIYGSSSTVQPSTLLALVCIKT